MAQATYFRIEKSYEDAATGDLLNDEWPVLWPTREAALAFYERRAPADWFADETASFALSGIARSGVELSFERLTSSALEVAA